VESYWLQHEGSLVWGLLLVAFAAFALWETFLPRRVLAAPTGRRWLNHAILSMLTNRGVFLTFRVGAVMVAYSVAGSHYGLLNREFLPVWLRYALAILLVDLSRYAHHYLYHAVPLLWRVHRVHHSDPDYDWSRGLRFHPLEVLLSQGSDLLAIALLAPPVLAVLALEALEAALNLFQHANVALPAWIESPLRLFLITPDMHRIHHSDAIAEQNTNYGITFPWWDRLFGTYLQEPAADRRRWGSACRKFPPNRLSAWRVCWRCRSGARARVSRLSVLGRPFLSIGPDKKQAGLRLVQTGPSPSLAIKERFDPHL
jgi:sterol desaturase/sphingolipid hydroxylase (fatty acid hydroxylase superfamily)